MIAAYMRQHPEVTNKSLIAGEVGVDRSTVERHYEAIKVDSKEIEIWGSKNPLGCCVAEDFA